MAYTKLEIQRKYDAIAPRYERLIVPMEILGMKKLRRRLLAGARGDVLEIGFGTGRNLPHYPEDCRLTALDLSPGMLESGRRRAETLGRPVRFVQGDAEQLCFPRRSFDTVVDSMNLCTFPDPDRALREMCRVCRPNGSILLLEHGRSDRGWMGRFQDWRAESHARELACHWNRDPLDLVRKAGLRVESQSRSFLGIFHEIVAGP